MKRKMLMLVPIAILSTMLVACGETAETGLLEEETVLSETIVEQEVTKIETEVREEQSGKKQEQLEATQEEIDKMQLLIHAMNNYYWSGVSYDPLDDAQYWGCLHYICMQCSYDYMDGTTFYTDEEGHGFASEELMSAYAQTAFYDRSNYSEVEIPEDMKEQIWVDQDGYYGFGEGDSGAVSTRINSITLKEDGSYLLSTDLLDESMGEELMASFEYVVVRNEKPDAYYPFSIIGLNSTATGETVAIISINNSTEK